MMTHHHPDNLTPVTDDAPAQRRAEIGRRVLLVLFALWLVTMSLAALYGVVLVRAAQVRLEDCTTPGRECYDDGARRSGELVGNITDAQQDAAVFAAACADRDGVQGQAEIERCVLASFKRKGTP